MLEALSQEFRAGVPWEDLYADDLVIIADSMDECVERLLTWKEAMERKGLRVNASKTKIMICGTGLNQLQDSGNFPCAVCRTGVGSNSIFCSSCKHWVHKKCSGLKRLTEDPNFRCSRCQEQLVGQVGSSRFFLLPGRHAFSSRRLRPCNHDTCENCLEEVQGNATSSHITPPVVQDPWSSV